MASRQEQKEARRQERLARERKESAAAVRRRRLQLSGGVILGLAVLAGLVLAAAVGFGGDDSDSAARTPEPGAPAAAKLPAQKSSDLQEAAKAAGCTLANPAFEGAAHEDKQFSAGDYKTNPPTSGNHTPDWYDDGIYEPGTTPRLGMLVHPLEHGRIEVQYKKGTPAKTVTQLEALLAEQNSGYHMLLFENTTGMDAAVAAAAWTHSLTCPEMNDKVFDAIRTFRSRYVDKGPETVP